MITTILTVCLGIQIIKTLAVTGVVLAGKDQMNGVVWRVAQFWCALEWTMSLGVGWCLVVLTK